jgi:hypothetical protein
MYKFLYDGSKFSTRTVAVRLEIGDVMLTLAKNGGVMRYTFWPGLGKRPIIDMTTKDPMAPESSLPGNPEGVDWKYDGI